MLVLSRTRGETIVIGEGIIITVVEIGRGRVRLGITAPGDVRVDRGEIHDRIERERRNGTNGRTER